MTGVFTWFAALHGNFPGQSLSGGVALVLRRASIDTGWQVDGWLVMTTTVKPASGASPRAVARFAEKPL